MRNFIFSFFLLVFFSLPTITSAQNHFYLGLGTVSSFGNTISEDVKYKSKNLLDFSLFCGNEFTINDYIKTSLEVFYLNNRLVLAREENKRFELHQNIGISLKPGLYYKRHTIYFNIGLTAVYVFDKDEIQGNQYDHFDDSFFYGFDYNYSITEKIAMNLGFTHAKFESISHFTNHTLKNFSNLMLSLNYNLY